ncbi:MAG: class B sortase [Oscillospiraceae bacterium]
MKSRLISIIETLLIGVFIFSIANLADIFGSYKKGDDIYSESKQFFTYHEKGKDNGNNSETYTIDINGLQKINPDIIAWIYIKDTKVSYPLLQSTTNEEYLKKTFNNKTSDFGSIFVDYRNASQLTDRYSLIYGHNTKNGSMFGSLKKYKDVNYYNQHPQISIIYADKIYQYEIFSAYTTYTDSPAYNFIYTGDGEYKIFLDKISGLSEIKTNIPTTVSDRIITLSTCTSRTENERFVVHARLASVTQNNTPITIDKA